MAAGKQRVLRFAQNDNFLFGQTAGPSASASSGQDDNIAVQNKSPACGCFAVSRADLYFF
jgi:hypothetical protein